MFHNIYVSKNLDKCEYSFQIVENHYEVNRGGLTISFHGFFFMTWFYELPGTFHIFFFTLSKETMMKNS